MSKLLLGKAPFAIAAMLLVLAALCGYFYYALGASETRMLKEQAMEKQQDVGLICNIVDTMVDLNRIEGNGHYDFTLILKNAVSYIEREYHSTFAQVYDSDLNPLLELQPGVAGGQKHDPLQYPEFVAAVLTKESGSLSYIYSTEEAGAREVYITFRWVPTDPEYTNRYLVAVAISKYTISNALDPKVAYGAIVLIAITSLLIVTTIILITQLGYIRASRGGADKWRGQLST